MWRVSSTSKNPQAPRTFPAPAQTGPGDGPSERAALAMAVRDAVRTWRDPMSRRHIHPEISSVEIDLLEAERMVMAENLNGALDGGER